MFVVIVESQSAESGKFFRGSELILAEDPGYELVVGIVYDISIIIFDFGCYRRVVISIIAQGGSDKEIMFVMIKAPGEIGKGNLLRGLVTFRSVIAVLQVIGK